MRMKRTNKRREPVRFVPLRGALPKNSHECSLMIRGVRYCRRWRSWLCESAPAPVVDRSVAAAITTTPALPSTVSRLAKDGIYVAQRVTRFRTSHRIRRRRERSARLERIFRVGYTDPAALQVTPPASVAIVSPITGSGQAEVRPLPPPGAYTPAPTPEAPAQLPPVVVPPTPSPPASASPPSTVPPVAAVPEPSRAPAASLPWIWPTPGKVIETFDDPRNKGIDIAVNEGRRCKPGGWRGVYVGSAVRGTHLVCATRRLLRLIRTEVLVAENNRSSAGKRSQSLGAPMRIARSCTSKFGIRANRSIRLSICLQDRSDTGSGL